MLINILREANGLGVRVPDQVDETFLVRTDTRFEDDEKIMEATEYCFAGCSGQAHVTNVPDSEANFCNHHVHRSVHGTIKRWPVEAQAIAQPLT